MMKKFLNNLPHPPSVLEIGVDKGITFIPLAAYLVSSKENFKLIGIDILLQQNIMFTLQGLEPVKDKQVVALVENNSLEVLPTLQKENFKFDLVLIDGDHNYHTVSKELSMLNDITYDHSMVIIDDYEGRWAEKDLWYAERPGYSEVKTASKRKRTKKHGIKAAVDDFIESKLGAEWVKMRPINGEPIMLMKVKSA